jgi:hypothetical protein
VTTFQIKTEKSLLLPVPAVGPDVQGNDHIGPGGFQETRGYPKKVQSAELAKNDDVAANLWDVSEEMTGVSYF